MGNAEDYNTFTEIFQSVIQDVGGFFQSLFLFGNNLVNFNQNVVLLISSCYAKEQEIMTLVQFYENKMKENYQLVWIPVDYTSHEENYSVLQSLMPWYTFTMQQMSCIKSGFIRYIKEQWNIFSQQTILFTLNVNGNKPSPYTLFNLWMCENVEQLFPPSGGQILAPWLEKPQLTPSLILGGIITVIISLQHYPI